MGTVVSLVKASDQKAELIYNALVQRLETEAIIADELWSLVKKQKPCLLNELTVEDCWIELIFI